MLDALDLVHGIRQAQRRGQAKALLWPCEPHDRDTITAALARGDRVELRDFGVFAVKTREARTGRNPRNGAEVAVSEKVTGRSRPAGTCIVGSTRPELPVCACGAITLGFVSPTRQDTHEAHGMTWPTDKRGNKCGSAAPHGSLRHPLERT